jgi:Protein of unknown function (DUF2510)
MTSPAGAVAGYYPDPAGSGSLRWWDGQRWTDHLVAPTPFAQPAAATPVFSAEPWPSGVSVLAAGSADRRSGVGMGKLAIAGLCLVLLVAGFVGWRARSPADPAGSTSATRLGGVTPPTTGSPVPSTQPPKPRKPGEVVVTPTEAAQVLRDFWPAHERAVVARDVTGLRRLETGAAAVYEPGSVACGCLSVASPRPLVKTAFFIPKQTDYPAHFLVEALHESSGTWTEILVFTKATASAPWLVAENSGFAPLSGPARLGRAVTDADGYVLPPSKQQHARAQHIAGQLASLWQQAKDTGRVPAQIIFETRGQTGGRLAEIAAYPQDELQSNGLRGHARFYVDPADQLVEFNDVGFDLACQSIRETMAYRPGAGREILQDSARENWGLLVAPGRYTSVTNHGAWQTCFLISPDPNAPVTVLNQDDDGGVTTAT